VQSDDHTPSLPQMTAGGDARAPQFFSFADGFYEWQKAGKSNCFGAYTSPDLIVNLSFTPSHSKPGTSVATPLTPRGPAQNQKISGSTYVGNDELGLSIKIKAKLVRAGVGRHRPGEQAPPVVP
jgi:hypothetical protein